MPRNLSTTAKQSIYAQSTSESWMLLLTINNDIFTDPIRICDKSYELLPLAGVRGVVSQGNEFLFVPMNINLPIQDDTGISRASISVDNISREIVRNIRSARTALSITMEVVLSSDPDVIELSAEDFRLERVSYDALTVSGDISVEYFDSEPYPAKRFTPPDFPGIF